jgi:anti-sigma-K factor RskA
MTGDRDIPPPGEFPGDGSGEAPDTVLAAEYALGLMDAAEARAFAARLDAEPALRRLVAEWEEGFAPLADAVPPVAPPARLKSRIEAAIAPAPVLAPRRRSWGWLGGMLAAGAVAVAVLLVLPVRHVTLPPSFTAAIAATDGSLQLAAALSGDRLRVERLAGVAPQGRVLELWLIAEGATAPVSLGVLPEAGVADLTVPAALTAAFAGGVLAVSDEPPGGSPTGAPTGTVLATGAITSL